MSFSLSSTPRLGSFPQNWIAKFSFLFMRTRRSEAIRVGIHLNQKHKVHSPSSTGNFFPHSFAFFLYSYTLCLSCMVLCNINKTKEKLLAHFQKWHFHFTQSILFLGVYHPTYSLMIKGSPHFVMFACHS